MGLLDGARLVAIDTETTGFDPRAHSVLEVGVASLENGRLGATWSTLVNPGRPIPIGASAVHGITDAAIAGAPEAREVARRLRETCGESPVVFHNAPFDLPFLTRMLKEAGAAPLFNPVVDTLGLARGVLRLPGYGLGAVAAALGLPPEPSHRALGDALTTARLLVALAERWERERGIRTLAELAAVSQDALRATNAERGRAQLASLFALPEPALARQLPLL